MVAPHAGAWIEICRYSARAFRSGTSLPTRERGLKYDDLVLRQERTESLPTRERGLKSSGFIPKQKAHASLPTRERGLKSWEEFLLALWDWSLPTRERGLKYLDKPGLSPYKGRSLRGSVD